MIDITDIFSIYYPSLVASPAVGEGSKVFAPLFSAPLQYFSYIPVVPFLQRGPLLLVFDFL
jgi:hypothetical protein